MRDKGLVDRIEGDCGANLRKTKNQHCHTKDDDPGDIYEEGNGPRVALVSKVVPGLKESNWNNSVEKSKQEKRVAAHLQAGCRSKHQQDGGTIVVCERTLMPQ